MPNMNIVHSDGDLFCATMTLQNCQLKGVVEGLTISYPNFFKLYISPGFILLSTLARKFAKLALMGEKIAKFQHGATIAPWFQQVDRAHTPLTLYIQPFRTRCSVRAR